MNAKLIVEGKEFDIEILDPELQKLIAPKKQTGYERVAIGDHYYTCGCNDNIYKMTEAGAPDECIYDGANYYSDKTLAENNCRADKLMRQLRRFAAEHNKYTKQRNMIEVSKAWVIKYEKKTGLRAKEVESTYFGDIYFDSYETAKLAVDTFHDELIWYFTEYKDSL